MEQDKQDKIENIKKLMDINGSTRSNDKTISQILRAIKISDPNFDDSKIDMKDLKKTIEELKEQIVLIYDKNLTENEVNGFIDFYESKIGRAYLRKMWYITNESMEIGSKYGEILYTKIMNPSDNQSSSSSSS